MEAVIRVRSWFAKAGMLDTVVSKSKSKPSITAEPKGRGTEAPVLGPKMDQRFVAAVTAAAEVEKPPSV